MSTITQLFLEVAASLPDDCTLEVQQPWTAVETTIFAFEEPM